MVGVVGKIAARSRGIGLPSPEALRGLDADVDNLREALEIAARDAQPNRELAVAAGVWHYWFHRGHVMEGRLRYEAILERRGLIPTRDGIRTARAAASFAFSLGDYERSGELGHLALAAAEEVGDVLEQAGAHNLLGVLANSQHEAATAETHLVEAIRLAESDGNIDAASMPRLNLGVAYTEAGRLDEAREEFHALLAYHRAKGLGLTEGVGLAHTNLGEVEYAAGNLAAAEEHFAAAAEAFRAIGFKARLAGALQGLAAVETRSGRAESAAKRLGTASALLTDTGWVRDGLALEEPATTAAREALGDEAFDRLFREGLAAGAS
jgi:tetratricopeptide (TPR) repeat protein